MADGSLAIGIDIGGTKVAGGIVDSDGNVLARARRDTPHRSTTPRVVEDTIVSLVDDSTGDLGTTDVDADGERTVSHGVPPAGRRRH